MNGFEKNYFFFTDQTHLRVTHIIFSLFIYVFMMLAY